MVSDLFYIYCGSSQALNYTQLKTLRQQHLLFSEACSSIRYLPTGLCTDCGLLDFGIQPVERQINVAGKREENNDGFLCLG